MSEQDEVENGESRGGEGTALSASDGVQGVPAETDSQVDDVITYEEDATGEIEDGDLSHPPGEGEQQPGSELEETAVMEEASVQQPLSAKGDGDQTATSSEQGLRYANPYGTFITGIDVNSEVHVYACSHGNIFKSQKEIWISNVGKFLNYNQLKLMFEGTMYILNESLSFNYGDDTCTCVCMYCPTGGSIEEVAEGSPV